MITKEKVQIYKYFNGDIDGWARTGTKEQKAIMKDRDWLLIEELVQDMSLIKKGLASESYINVINEKLQANCDSNETIQEIKNL